jgi:hypothetical protein
MYIEIPSTETRLCEQCPIESLPLHCDIRNSHPYSALTDPLPRILSLGGLTIHTGLASRVGNDAASVALMLGERDE